MTENEIGTIIVETAILVYFGPGLLEPVYRVYLKSQHSAPLRLRRRFRVKLFLSLKLHFTTKRTKATKCLARLRSGSSCPVVKCTRLIFVNSFRQLK